MAEVTTGITMEQLQQLMAAQAEMTKSIVAEAIKAAKEPSADEQEKRKELQRRAAISRKQAIDQQHAEEQAKEQRHKNCRNGHHKENGKWATSGQVVANKYGFLICLYCQDVWYKEFAPDVVAQLLSGDMTLFQADPTGWSKEKPWPQPQLETAVA